MKKDSKKDSAVSPVIGTILLVAITVVLVAIISAVVMGMTGNVDSAHTVGVKATSDGKLIITGGDYGQLVAVSINGADFNSDTTYSIGDSIGTVGANTIIGKFSDGSQQIIYSKQ